MAGNALNWTGEYLAETEARHDELNSSMDCILNFGGFMYIGTILPFSDWQQPDTTGLTIPRLMILGVLVLIFRRIPAIFMTYKLMPNCVKGWKEALFMGYFGPIGKSCTFHQTRCVILLISSPGIGAVFYIEHTRHLFPEQGEGDTEENNLTAVMRPGISMPHAVLARC